MPIAFWGVIQVNTKTIVLGVSITFSLFPTSHIVLMWCELKHLEV